MNERISELYEKEESRGFFFHLMKSYMQAGKTRKVIDFGEGQKKRCALCDAKLISLNDAVATFAKGGADAFTEALKAMVANPSGGVGDEHAAQIKKMFDYRVMGHTADGTNTCLCANCVNDLFEYVAAQCLDGNKEINNVVSGLVRKERNEAYEATLSPDQKKERDAMREVRTIKFGGTKLNDNPQLQAMKAALSRGK